MGLKCIKPILAKMRERRDHYVFVIYVFSRGFHIILEQLIWKLLFWSTLKRLYFSPNDRRKGCSLSWILSLISLSSSLFSSHLFLSILLSPQTLDTSLSHVANLL